MGKYTIDLNKSLIDLDGSEIQNGNMGKILAASIVNQSKGDAIKLYGWAVDMSKGNVIIIDKSDYDTLKNFIKDSESMTVITKAQILNIVNEAKEE